MVLTQQEAAAHVEVCESDAAAASAEKAARSHDFSDPPTKPLGVHLPGEERPPEKVKGDRVCQSDTFQKHMKTFDERGPVGPVFMAPGWSSLNK